MKKSEEETITALQSLFAKVETLRQINIRDVFKPDVYFLYEQTLTILPSFAIQEDKEKHRKVLEAAMRTRKEKYRTFMQKKRLQAGSDLDTIS